MTCNMDFSFFQACPLEMESPKHMFLSMSLRIYESSFAWIQLYNNKQLVCCLVLYEESKLHFV